MASDPAKPLLRLNVSAPGPRETGSPRSVPGSKKYSVADQIARHGKKFGRLQEVLARNPDGLELRSDPSVLAPERLLVFEVKGSVQNFANAIRNVPGLELIDEEGLESDEQDKNPVAYLLVPDATALRQIESLWQRWTRSENLGTGLTPWRDVFATLKDLRPWGPQDRVEDEERDILAGEISGKSDDALLRLEIELVFRNNGALGAKSETDLRSQIVSRGGQIVSQCRIDDIGYHAILADLPVSEIRGIVHRQQTSIAGYDLVMHIRPQSLAASTEVADTGDLPEGTIPPNVHVPALGSSILALLDGVPVAQHPLLTGALIVDDQFGLEPLAQVNERTHGTAMASLIVHGDRNRQDQRLNRHVHCVPVLGQADKFPEDRLIVDVIYLAVMAMRQGDDATAPDVLIVNLSLGNTRKPFHGRLSAWARLLDRLSYRFGILFLVSAGNHRNSFNIPNFENFIDFENASPDQRAESVLTGLGNLMGERRLLSPSETVNGISVGAANVDAVSAADRRSARNNVDPFQEITISNPSSALGPGFSNSVKPDLLMPGAREHLRMQSSGSLLSVLPSGPARAHGLKVAAPPRDGMAMSEGYSNGTSAATALASRTCHQIHDALQSAYGETFTSLSHAQRAVLLKALLVHSASWPQEAYDLIMGVLGPSDNKKHVQQKDNIRRFLGYGVADPDLAIACVDDRATFWATGTLPREQKSLIEVPVPICINGKKQPHALSATLAWFTPTYPGRQTYRAVRLSLAEPNEIKTLAVSGAGTQPDVNQSRRGTVISRRWEGGKAPRIATDSVISLAVQREPDQGVPIDEPIPFGLAVTLTMPGVMGIYEEVRTRLGIQLPVRVS